MSVMWRWIREPFSVTIPLPCQKLRVEIITGRGNTAMMSGLLPTRLEQTSDAKGEDYNV